MSEPTLIPPGAVEALRAGNKIEAIKRVREATGMGLAEAKGLVDAYERGSPVAPGMARTAGRPAGLAPGEQPSSNPWRVIAIALLLVVVGLVVVLLTR